MAGSVAGFVSVGDVLVDAVALNKGTDANGAVVADASFALQWDRGGSFLCEQH